MSNRSIGIIGCGLIADTHVLALKKAVSDAHISVCDPIPGKAELLKRKYQLKGSYLRIEEMLHREKPFSVHVLSPPQLHVEHALQCLEAGSHVLVEKPLAFKISDVDRVYEAARRCNKVLCVDHSLLYQPSVQRMFKKMESGPPSQVLYVNCSYGLDVGGISSSLPEGHWKLELPGGAIIDTIIHPITLAVELSGRPIDLQIHFSGSSDNPEKIHISWYGEKAIVSIFVSSRVQPFRRVTEVATDKETFVLDHSTETLISLGAGFGPRAVRKVWKNFGYGFQLLLGTTATIFQVMRGKLKENPGATGLIEAFYRHLAGGGEMPVSEESARRSVQALESIIAKINGTIKKTTDTSQDVQEKARGSSPKSASTRTLVTGASGLLGQHLCRMLPARNRRVLAQVRRGPNADRLSFPGIERIFEDFEYEPVNYDRLLDGVEEIVHCAYAAGARTWQQVERINVDATLSLYDAAARLGCHKFVFLSSLAVYGVHQRGRISVTEDTPTTEGKSKWDFYVRSKAITEKLLLEKAKEGPPKLLILRPGVLYAPDGTRLARRSIPLRNSRLLIGIGSGYNHIPYTRVDVLSANICEILDLDYFPEGIYNTTGNPNETAKEFIRSRMKQIGIQCRFIAIPAFPLRLLAYLFEATYALALRKTSPPITRYIIDSSTRDIHYDCSQAEKYLAWDQKAAIKF